MKQRIKNFFIEEDLSVLLGWLGINYKKAMNNRIKTSILILILFLVLGVIMKNIYVIISSFFVALIFYKYQYYSTKNKRKKLIVLKRRMFPSFVKKLLILLRTNNIYVSLNKMLDFTDDPIKKYLVQLIDEIDKDKSVQPYINFANNMEFIEAYQIMIMLYSFSEKAMNQKHLSNLENMIFQLYNNEIDEVVESKKRLMWMYPNFTILTMMALIFALAIFMLFDTLKGVSVV